MESLTHLKNSHSDKHLLSQTLSEAQKLSILLKNKQAINKSSLVRLSLDKKREGQSQLASLQHPKTMDEKALEAQDRKFSGKSQMHHRSSFLKRSKKLSDIHSVVIENPEKESIPFKTPRTDEVMFFPTSSGEQKHSPEIIKLRNLLSDDTTKGIPSEETMLVTELVTDAESKKSDDLQTPLETQGKGSEVRGGGFKGKSASFRMRSSGKKGSNLQKKLLSQKKRQRNFQAFSRKTGKKQIAKQMSSNLNKSQNKSKLTDILMKNFKKMNTRKNLKKNISNSYLSQKQKLSPQMSGVNCNHKNAFIPTKSSENPEKYLSSCNLVSTNQFEAFDSDTSKISKIKGFSLFEEKTFERSNSTFKENSIGLQSRAMNEMHTKKSDFLRDKEKIESKIAKIDQKLKQIDRKLMSINKQKKTRLSKEHFQMEERTSEAKSQTTELRRRLPKSKFGWSQVRTKSRLIRQNPRAPRARFTSQYPKRSTLKSSNFSHSVQSNSHKKKQKNISTFTSKQFINL